MARRIIECVPNFSEGRDKDIVRQIASAVMGVDGVRLLNVDSGEATNRTVLTFVGEPEAVCEAAFRAARKAAETIDMRKHHGEHPRIGATDVLPLVPVSGTTVGECASMARRLAQRMSDELGIPCYCYEVAALRPEHRNLADCRKGEYEGIAAKLADAVMAPDYGARPYDEGVARTGCSVVGAREFLVAVNFNLDTTTVDTAIDIACDVRESGRRGKPGTLKSVKAIGWYIKEYGRAQVSMNLTDINVTPLHVAYSEVCRCAALRGARVTGTEIIGLVPERTLVEAGRFFLGDGTSCAGATKYELMSVAIERMGLSELRPFRIEEKVIESFL